jgi:hypothetical protein
LHRDRHLHRRGGGLSTSHRIVEEDHDAVPGESFEGAFVRRDEPAPWRRIFADDAHDVFGSDVR